MAVLIYILTNNVRVAPFSISSLAFNFCFFANSQSYWNKMVLPGILICISLIISDLDIFLMYLLAVYKSVFEKCLICSFLKFGFFRDFAVEFLIYSGY